MMPTQVSVGDRIILLTGASRGLGRAMALGLLEGGARVILASTGPSAHLAAALGEARKRAPESRFVTVFGDLCRYEDCVRIHTEATAVFGPIDVLINNATIPMAGPGPCSGR